MTATRDQDLWPLGSTGSLRRTLYSLKVVRARVALYSVIGGLLIGEPTEGHEMGMGEGPGGGGGLQPGGGGGPGRPPGGAGGPIDTVPQLPGGGGGGAG